MNDCRPLCAEALSALFCTGCLKTIQLLLTAGQVHSPPEYVLEFAGVLCHGYAELAGVYVCMSRRAAVGALNGHSCCAAGTC